MLFAAALFVAMDSIAKHLGQRYSAPQLVWARYGIHLLIMLVCLLSTGRFGRRLLVSQAPLGQFTRGLLLLGATTFSYLSVRELPLTQVYVVNFSSPVIVTLLAVPLLGERVGWVRISAVVCGFLGVVIAMNPGGELATPALIFPVCMAIFFALYQLATRCYGNQDSPVTSLFYTALAGGIVSTLVVPYFWLPVADGDVVFFLALGVIGAGSHFLLIMAMRLSPASLVSPFLYSQLIWATISGYVFFGDLPKEGTLMGAALVIGSGLYLVLYGRATREYK